MEKTEASSPAREKALQTAANVLQYHHRSAQALYDRLLEKEIPEQDAAYAVARLQELGYLNDTEYGRRLVRDLAQRGYGAARIRRTLMEKKLSKEDIELAMEEYSPDEARMQSYIRSRLQPGQTDRRRIKQVSDGLFRRGFCWEEIRAALQVYADQWEEEE